MFLEVDRTGSQPIYDQLASWMEANILSEEWPPDYKFQGEVELAESLGVSRGSLRKAIGILIDKGLVVQIHGKGTFVSRKLLIQSYTPRLGVYQDLMTIGVPFVTEVLEQSIIPAWEKVAHRLDLALSEQVFFLKRLRRVSDIPLVLQESYFPAKRFGGLLGEDFVNQGMVELVEQNFKVILEWNSHTISVAKANPTVARLLELKVGDPVLLTESILFDDEGNKVEIGYAWFRPDRFRLKTTTRRAQNEPFYSILGRSTNPAFRKRDSDIFSQPNAQGNLSLRIAEFLPKERISINFKAADWMDAILHAGALLYASGAVEERYGQAMVTTARMLGPYFVVSPGIAVAHALPQEGVIKPALAMVTLQPPIPFGNKMNDPVQLLIAIAAVDTQQHVEALRGIAEFLFDPQRRKALVQAVTPSEAFALLTGK